MSKLFFLIFKFFYIYSGILCLSSPISYHPPLFSATRLLLYSLVWQVIFSQNISGPTCSSRNLLLSQEAESIFHPFEPGWDFMSSLWREWGGSASCFVTLGCKSDKASRCCWFSSLRMLTFRARTPCWEEAEHHMKRPCVRVPGGGEVSCLHQALAKFQLHEEN